MAVSSEDIKLKVVIDSGNADLSGITRAGEELSSVGKSGEAAIDRISAAVNNLNSKGASIASAGDGLKNITSNASATESSLNSLGKELAQVHSQFASLRSGTEAFDALKAKSADLQAQIQQLKGTTVNVVSPDTITNTKALNSSLIDISRVISDMPYGMQGIANNLQQLPGSFGRLRAEADATGQSMTSMLVQGAMSPMGASIAVAAVTAMWVAWDMYGVKVISAFGGAEKASDDFKASVKGISEYKDFTLNVQIAGMSKLDQLDKKLDVIAVKMKMVQQEESWNNREKAQPKGFAAYLSDATNVLSGNYSPSSMVGGQIENEKTAVWKEYGRALVQGVWDAEASKSTNNLVTYGPDRNKQALSALGYSEKDIVLFNEHLNVLAEKYGVVAEKAKEFAKENKKATGTAPADYTAEWNDYQTAIKNSTDYLEKQDMATLSLGQAEMVAAGTKASLIAAQHEATTGGADYKRVTWDIAEAQKAAATADELVKWTCNNKMDTSRSHNF